MSYVESSLIPGEKVLQRARHHWIMPAARVFWFAVFVSAGLVMLLASGPLLHWAADELVKDGKQWNSVDSWVTGVRWAGGILILLALWGHLSFWLWLWSTEYAVTDNRVIMKDGLIRRNTYEVQLHQLVKLGVHQGVIGRILGYGSVTMAAAGGAHGGWHRIADPLHFKKHIEQAAQKRQGGGQAAARPDPSNSPAPAAEPARDGPGRFRVLGVNRETREDTELLVEAGSGANAKVKGELEGMIVTGVERLDDET